MGTIAIETVAKGGVFEYTVVSWRLLSMRVFVDSVVSDRQKPVIFL